MRLRIIRLDPSFLDLVNTPDTNILFSVSFAFATIFFLLSNTTSFFTIFTINNTSFFYKFLLRASRNANLELDFGVSIRFSFSPFSITSTIILSLVTFFHLVKWFLRFSPLKFLIYLFRTGLQISFFWGIVIVVTPVVIFGGFFNFWFSYCCCTSCFDFQGFLEIFGIFLSFYSKENLNGSATCFDLPEWGLS